MKKIHSRRRGTQRVRTLSTLDHENSKNEMKQRYIIRNAQNREKENKAGRKESGMPNE